MDQDKTFDPIVRALGSARIAMYNADILCCIDWLTTVQLKTAELAATLMTRITNKPD